MIAAMATGQIGLIDQPRQRQITMTDAAHDAGVTWCADNGCFADKWDEQAWWKFLVKNAHRAETCLFAVAPDVVGDAAATIERSAPWLPKIRKLGYPVAFVGQNGLEDRSVPWHEFDVLFLGGSLECVPCGYVYREKRKPARDEPCPLCNRLLIEWKEGAVARELVSEAKRRGKWVHMGRVNSERRYLYAAAIGCDSADGTFLTYGPEANLPRLLAWTRTNDQLELFGGIA